MITNLRVFFVLFFSIVLFPLIVTAQFEGTTPKSGSSGRKSGAVKVITKTNTVTNTVIKTVEVKSLVVTTEPGASVTLSSAKGKPIIKPATGGTAIFEKLPTGTYSISASKNEFKTIAVSKAYKANTSDAVQITLPPITYPLKITTNIPNGSVRYSKLLDGANVPMTIGTEGLTDYCVKVLHRNGDKSDVELPDLARSRYVIDVLPDDPAYAPSRNFVTVPDGEAAAGTVRNKQIDLEFKASKLTFSSSAWSPGDWSLPSQWRLDKGMKIRNASGVALPLNPDYRYYIDFQLDAGVKLNDDGYAAFALRAVDSQNYYLFVINGKNGTPADTAALYRVKDGQMGPPLRSLTTAGVASTISSNSGFTLHINAVKGDFVVQIEDNNTGQTSNLGGFSDPLNQLPKGAVGVAAIGRPDFDVRSFKVCTPRCAQ